MADPKLPIPLGTLVKPWGIVSAVRWDGSERYYMLVHPDDDKDVSLMPSALVERNWLEQTT